MVFRSTPVAAVAPIMMLIFGRGINTSMAVVMVVSFFPMLVNMMRGHWKAQIKTPRSCCTSTALHAGSTFAWSAFRSRYRIFSRVSRVAGSSAILGAMLSEWICTGSKGLGNLILDAYEMREIELLWAAVLTSVAIALVVLLDRPQSARSGLLRWTNR